MELFVGVGVCMCVERCMVDFRWWMRDFLVVGGRIEVDDVEMGFEKFDGGDEGFVLDIVFVEVIGMVV